ncbi:MAG: permease [Halobacteria archaeon]
MNAKEYMVLGAIGVISIIVGVDHSSAPLTEFLTKGFEQSMSFAFLMWWETWWALVLGFGIAGAVEAWIPKEEISGMLKGHSIKELGLASFFGFISSSCSFSAIATGKNLFKKGASAAASLGAFMFASTNLVIEIGLVIWLLLGWQFVAANFLGGLILIALMALIFVYLVPNGIIEEGRRHAQGEEEDVVQDPVCGMEISKDECEHTITDRGKTYYFCSEGCRSSFNPEDQETQKSIKENLYSRDGWRDLADKQWKEWGMLWEDIAVGFILAGIIASFVPNQTWTQLFHLVPEGTYGTMVFVTWTAVIGVVVGIITFVCSVGNVPFAAVLWAAGLPFGSILSYIYADLIVPPIMNAYKKYYGTRFAVILILMIFGTAVATGIIIHFVFTGVGMVPPRSSATIVDKSIELNYKAWLNGIFSLVFIGLYYLHRESKTSA